MRNGSTVALVTVLLGGLALSGPAKAQFGTAANPSLGADATTKVQHTTIGIYPATPFTVSASGYNSTLVGSLLSVDYSFVKDRHSAFVFGGWAWFRDGADIEEIHAKYYFAPSWGIQGGVLGSTNGGGNPFDLFLNYHFTLGKSGSGHAVQMLAGAGAFFDPGGSSETTGFSGFLQAETPIAKNWTLNFSYWYLQDKGAEGHRFGLGVATRF